jgi:hypothetical protein
MGMAELLAQARARKTTALQRVEPPFIPPIPPQKHQSPNDFGNVAHKQELVEYLSRHAVNDAQAQADNTVNAVSDWQQADKAYQAHHVECPICRAAGLGKGSSCDEGQALWGAYEAAPMPELGKAKRVAPTLPAPARQPPRFTPRSNAEIDRLVMLHQQAMRVGLPDSNDTDKCLDAVMDAPLGMSACFACTHIRGASPTRWRCASTDSRNELSGSPLAPEFVMHLHRCPAFQGVNP